MLRYIIRNESMDVKGRSLILANGDYMKHNIRNPVGDRHR